MRADRLIDILRSRRLRVAAGVGLIGTAAVALSLSGVASPAHASHDRYARLWTWTAHVPGAKKDVGDLASEAARARGLDPATVRTVVASGVGGSAADLLAASLPAGRVCFAIAAPGEASNFSCRPPGQKEAVVVRLMYGGTTVDKVDHATVVGVARADVGSVAVTRADGTVSALALNRWRGFGDVATESDAFPTTLSAYGKKGALLQQVELGTFSSPN